MDMDSLTILSKKLVSATVSKLIIHQMSLTKKINLDVLILRMSMNHHNRYLKRTDLWIKAKLLKWSQTGLCQGKSELNSWMKK